MFDFRFYLALLLRRLPYILIFTVAGAAVGVGLALTLPPEYRANARLVVESEQIPGNLAESTVRVAATEQLQIIEQRIKARDTLLDMANRLEVYGSNIRSNDGPLRPDEIVQDLRERIIIRVGGGNRSRGVTNALLVDISFTDSSATLAAEVTNEVVTLMQQENRAMRTDVSGQTLEFFEQEVQRLNEELSRRGEEIIRFQEANRDSLPESMEFRRNQLIRAQEELLQTTRDEIELSDRRDAAVALFEQNGGIAGVADAGLTPEQRQLRALRERYTTSVAVLSLDNPRVQVMKAQIDALEDLVQSQAADAEDAAADAQTRSPEDAQRSLFDVQIAEIDSQLDFLRTRRTQLETEMATLQTTIEGTPANAIALDALQRDYAAVREQFDRAVANRARAKTGDIIEALSKGERITLVDAAVPPEQPFSPNRPRLAVMGTGGGFAIAMALIVLLEVLNTSIRRSQDIVRALDITPFGTLPYIRTREERRRRRLILTTALVGIVVIVVGGLYGVNEFVIPLDRILEKVIEQVPDLGLQF